MNSKDPNEQENQRQGGHGETKSASQVPSGERAEKRQGGHGETKGASQARHGGNAETKGASQTPPSDKRQGGNLETKGKSQAPPSGTEKSDAPTQPSGEGQPSIGEAAKKS